MGVPSHRIGAQSSDSIEHRSAMPDNNDAKVLQVLRR